jgi:hypothetical protein
MGLRTASYVDGISDAWDPHPDPVEGRHAAEHSTPANRLDHVGVRVRERVPAPPEPAQMPVAESLFDRVLRLADRQQFATAEHS